MNRTLSIFTLLMLAVPMDAADAWHLAAWQARAIVEIPQPLADGAVDTVAVKILCQGRAKPDGSDYRVLDSTGKPVPFQLVFHDAARYSLIAFQATNPKQRFFIYFNNPQAPKAAEQVILDEKPGAGPPKGAWIPKYGLILETRARPHVADIRKETNPQTPEEMGKLIAGSPRKFGARYQRRISDGYNPFGPSDYYISIYRGWINIPKPGKYKFCTISNEASFSFLDGKDLIHWPGHHTVERGLRGEKNATVELTAGLHYLEYYHEECTLEQMAFLGWRTSADEGPFSPIPETVYTAPHVGVVTAYEDAKGPLLTFEPTITDSIWPVDRDEGQYTRAKFVAGKFPQGTMFRWDFGDGQSTTGLEAEHVFLNVDKTYTVILNAEGPGGKQIVTWPLEIFSIEHITETFKEGRPVDYAKLVKGYDRSKLEAPALKELMHLLSESGDAAETVKAGDDFVKRFPVADALELARVRRLMADAALQLGQGGIDKAIENYQASIVKTLPATEKLHALVRLIRLLGIERNEYEKAIALLKQAEEVMKAARPKDADEAEQEEKAYRQTVIAAGDVRLWQSKSDDALTLFRRAEILRKNPIPPQVRAARIGSYPNSLREYIDGGNYAAAIELVNEWEDSFPTDKLNGHTFYWRGKLMQLRGQPSEGIRYLQRSVLVTTGAVFETEARWLLAQALEQTGKPDEAKKELQRLLAIGIQDDFTKKARERLKTKPEKR